MEVSVAGLLLGLDKFLQIVVGHRKERAVHGWKAWILEDPLARPYRWLLPDLVPPSPFLQCNPGETAGGSGVISDPALIDAKFRRLGCLISVGLLRVLLIWMISLWWLEVVGCLPPLTGDMLIVVRRKKSTAGILDGWGWREVKALPLPWFDGLARILRMVEESGVWPEGLLDAYIAMIPKSGGDATPLGQRPFVCIACGFIGSGRQLG